MKKKFLLAACVAGSLLHAQTTYVAPWQDISTFNYSSIEEHGGSRVIVDADTGEVFTVGTFEYSTTNNNISYISIASI